MKNYITSSIFVFLLAIFGYYLWHCEKQRALMEKRYLYEIERCNRKIEEHDRLLRLINAETSNHQEKREKYNLESLFTDEYGPV